MPTILITGATGNVGLEVLKSLKNLTPLLNIKAAVRDVTLDSAKLKGHNVSVVQFDLTDSATFTSALNNVDLVFLVRPPQIANVKKYFKPFIDSAVQAGVKHIVFLSVQGVEKSSVIPHHKIETLLKDSNIHFTFLRPAYFMQNFTTTLRNDLANNQRIFLPAGNAKFTLVDVRDIGKVAAIVLNNPAAHINKIYELTCNQKFTFYEMAEKLSSGLGRDIQYISPGMFTFYQTKRREKMPPMMILVMMILHVLPRFQTEPAVTDCIAKITGNAPTTFEQFIADNKGLLTQQK